MISVNPHFASCIRFSPNLEKYYGPKGASDIKKGMLLIDADVSDDEIKRLVPENKKRPETLVRFPSNMSVIVRPLPTKKDVTDPKTGRSVRSPKNKITCKDRILRALTGRLYKTNSVRITFILRDGEKSSRTVTCNDGQSIKLKGGETVNREFHHVVLCPREQGRFTRKCNSTQNPFNKGNLVNGNFEQLVKQLNMHLKVMALSDAEKLTQRHNPRPRAVDPDAVSYSFEPRRDGTIGPRENDTIN